MITSRETVATLFRRATKAAGVRALRSMREWAEAEYRIADGPVIGRFAVETNPWTGFWLDGIDSGLYQEHYLTGVVQGGKTLLGMNIPTCYHLFEVGETVILGAPTMDLCWDKWQRDIKPAIEASRYSNLLPTSGAGSKDGKPTAVKFGNGAFLKFMGAGGGDAKKSGYTARVVVMTELDKMDAAGKASREADPVSQMIARSSAYGARKRIYGECTTSIAEGRIHQMMLKGTGSRLALPCRTCGGHQVMERKHLVGWQGAANDVEAEERSAWACEHCGALWSEDERHAANAGALTIHRGQSVEAGRVVGEAPKTRIFSFRFNAGNNMISGKASVAGAKMWSLEQAVDEEAADRERSQFLWAEPFVPKIETDAPLTVEALLRRGSGFARGVVPPGTLRVCRGQDVGKHLIHWVDVAEVDDGRVVVVDFGTQETAADEIGVEAGVAQALAALDEMDATKPALALVDSRYMQKPVFEHCRKNPKCRAIQGLGDGAFRMPRQATKTDVLLGESFYLRVQQGQKIITMNLDADYWKLWVQRRLAMPDNALGAMVLPGEMKDVLFRFCRHITAERYVEEFVAGKGTVGKWVKSGPNHYLDATAYACAALSFERQAESMRRARGDGGGTPPSETKPTEPVGTGAGRAAGGSWRTPRE